MHRTRLLEKATGFVAIAFAMTIGARVVEGQSFGGEVLSARVVADFVFAPPARGVVPADPGVDHPLVVVLLWRGQAGWQTDSLRARRPATTAASAMSVGASSMTEHSHNVGGRDLAFRYDGRHRKIEVLGQSYDASQPVCILIDRADANGAQPEVVGVVKLSNPFVLPARWSETPGSAPAPRGVLLTRSLRQYPEIDAFLK